MYLESELDNFFIDSTTTENEKNEKFILKKMK